MLFNSLAFLAFFAAFLLPFFFTRGKARLVVCLVASYVFYGWWDWRFTGLLAFSTIVDFQVGKYLHATTDQAKRRRWLLVSLVVNLGLLGVFKYLNFFIDSAVEVSTALGLHASKKHLSLILPVGISFYTFQTLSYTLDIYRKQLEPEPSFVRFAAYVAFFPQLVAGPIVRAAEFLPQLRKDPRFDANRFESGMSLIAWGFVKKVVVADSLASVVDHRFRVPEAHDALSLGLGVFCYAFQIYADFSGYSDIAIGTARLLGYDFPENFRRPYFSTSFREFWRRWHITLSTWLRDYLYIPLGGNRTPGYRTYRNLMLTMLLGGLWHGANWTFVVWGGLH
ncbi:MAG: MBOAT family protein [Polyangiaceae bacterium]